MKKIILITGAPGSGKTSTSKEVVKLMDNICHYSMGEIFREEEKTNSKVGKEIGTYLAKGITVPINIAINAIQNIILNTQTKNIIIDGYPRDEEQLKIFNEYIKTQNIFKLIGFVEIQVSEQTAKERILKRNRGNDDSEALFKHRMKYYSKFRTIITETFKMQNKYFSINGNVKFEDACISLKHIINKLFL